MRMRARKDAEDFYNLVMIKSQQAAQEVTPVEIWAAGPVYQSRWDICP